MKVWPQLLPPKERAQRNKKISKLYAKGRSSSVIGKQFGLTKEHVQRIAKAAGVPSHPPSTVDIEVQAMRDKRNKKIVNEYLKGQSFKEIARSLGLGVPTVFYVVKKSGIKRRARSHLPDPEITKRHKKIVEMYKSGLGGSVISRRMGISNDVVYYAINKAGVIRGKQGHISPERVRRLEIRNQKIIKEYQQGNSIKSLSKKFSLAFTSISTIFKKHGIKLRPRVFPKREIPLHQRKRNHKIEKHFLKGKTPLQIARALGISYQAVINTLNKSDAALKILAPRKIQKLPSEIKNRNEEIAELYKEGESLEELSNQFQFDVNHVRRIVKKMGVPLRPHGFPRRGYRADLIPRNKRITQLYLTGKTPKQIAEKMRLSPGIVSNIVKQEGIARYRRVKNMRSKKHLEMKKRNDKIIDWYLQGDAVRELSQQFHLSGVSIREILHQNKVKLRPYSYKRLKPPDLKMLKRNKKIVKKYREGVPQKKIAVEFGLSPSQINNITRRSRSTNHAKDST